MAYKKGTWDLANTGPGKYLGFCSGWAMAPAGKEGEFYRDVTLTGEQWHSFWDEVNTLREKGWESLEGIEAGIEYRYYFDSKGLPHPIEDYLSFNYKDLDADPERETYRIR